MKIAQWHLASDGIDITVGDLKNESIQGSYSLRFMAKVSLSNHMNNHNIML